MRVVPATGSEERRVRWAETPFSLSPPPGTQSLCPLALPWGHSLLWHPLCTAGGDGLLNLEVLGSGCRLWCWVGGAVGPTLQGECPARCCPPGM